MIIPQPTVGAGSSYRLKRGMKASELPQPASASELPALSAFDGPFQLAEYLSLKVRADPHDVKGLVEVPAEGRSTDRDVWVYEHLRRLPIDLTLLVSQLLLHCSKTTCPEMKAGEWLYLCVSHGNGGNEDCCAIDYILHTLDSTTAILNSAKNFPSRMQIPPASLSHFPSLSRRLSRIFSHAYFHHREQFLMAESETSLYKRFVALCDKYELVGQELLVIPHDVAADDSEWWERDDGRATARGRTRHEGRDQLGEGNGGTDGPEAEDDAEGDVDWDGDGGAEVDDHAGESRREREGSRRTRSLDRDTKVGETASKGGPQTEQAVSSQAPTGAAAPTAMINSGHDAAGNLSSASVEGSPSNTVEDRASIDDTEASVSRKGGPEQQTARKAVPTIKSAKGTLPRGKQSRGTMLWSSDSPPVPPVPPTLPSLAPKSGDSSSPVSQGGKPPADSKSSRASSTSMNRRDSTESAIFVGDSPSSASIDDSAGGLAQSGEAVPKDEIELLQERGDLPAQSTVSPLPPPSKRESITIPPEPAATDGNSHSGILKPAGSQSDAGSSTALSGDNISRSPPKTVRFPTKLDETIPTSSPSDSSSHAEAATTAPKPSASRITTAQTSSPSPSSSPTRQIISPAPLSPSAETVGIYASTAATSPLNPPRSLSRSPEKTKGGLAASEVGRLPDVPSVDPLVENGAVDHDQ